MADDARISTEAAHPKSVAEQDQMLSLRLLLVREEAAHRRHHPNRPQETGGADRSPDALGRAFAGEVRRPQRLYSKLLERPVAFLVVEIVGAGERLPSKLLRRFLPHRYQPVGLRVRKRRQKDALLDAEDRGSGRYAQRQRDQGSGREAGASPEDSRRVPEVPHGRLQPGKSAAVPAGLFSGLHAARFQKRGTAGLSRRHSGANVALDLHREVALELLGQVTVSTLLAKQIDQAEQEGADGSHEASPDGAKKRPMMAVVRPHSRASFCNCFFPARVRV